MAAYRLTGLPAWRRGGVAAWQFVDVLRGEAQSAEGVVQDSLGRSPRNYSKIGDQR